MDASESYAKWACHGCYGKHFIAGFKHGVTVDKKLDIDRNTKIITIFGGKEITLLKRVYTKTVNTLHKFFSPMGVAPNGPVDTTYVSYVDCDNNPADTNTANYSVSSEFINTQIYYADLRNDILVYYSEEGGSDTSASGNTPMGLGLGYGGWQGGEPACQSINTRDAIKLPLNISDNVTKKEIITLGNYEPYNKTINETIPLNVAGVTEAPTCGGVSDECAHWGGYDRVDVSKPYNCETGEFTNEVEVEDITEYINSWDSVGAWGNIDAYDRGQWVGNFKQGWDGSEYVGEIEDGEYSYPNFIQIDALPHGSFAVDSAGNYFHSMVTKDLGVFNKLNTKDPNEVSNLEGSNIVFYPLAPI